MSIFFFGYKLQNPKTVVISIDLGVTVAVTMVTLSNFLNI